jgi:hypothetical protein
MSFPAPPPLRIAAFEPDTRSDIHGGYFDIHYRHEAVINKHLENWPTTFKEHSRFVTPFNFSGQKLTLKCLLNLDLTVLSEKEKLKTEIAYLSKLYDFCYNNHGCHQPVLAAMSAGGRMSGPAASWQNRRSVLRYDKTLKCRYFKNAVPFNRGAKPDLKIIGKTGPYAVYQVAHAGYDTINDILFVWLYVDKIPVWQDVPGHHEFVSPTDLEVRRLTRGMWVMAQENPEWMKRPEEDLDEAYSTYEPDEDLEDNEDNNDNGNNISDEDETTYGGMTTLDGRTYQQRSMKCVLRFRRAH